MTTVAQSPSPNNFDTIWEAGLPRLLELQAEAASAPREPLPDGAVQIDGQVWLVRDTLTVKHLRRMSRRMAESWQERGITAKVELVRARGGRVPHVAYQHRDGSFSRPWRGSLVVGN